MSLIPPPPLSLKRWSGWGAISEFCALEQSAQPSTYPIKFVGRHIQMLHFIIMKKCQPSIEVHVMLCNNKARVPFGTLDPDIAFFYTHINIILLF